MPELTFAPTRPLNLLAGAGIALTMATVVYLADTMGLAAVIALVGLLLTCFTHPLVPFALYFTALFFKDTTVAALPVSINQVLAPVFFLATFIHFLRGRTHSGRYSLLPLLTLVGCYFILRGVTSEHLETGLIYSRYVLIYLVLAICVALSLNSERAIMAFTWIIVLITTGFAVHGFLEGVEKNLLAGLAGSWNFSARVVGTAPNAIVFGWNMVFALPFIFLLYSQSGSRYTRMFALSLSTIILIAAAMTFNRQTYLLIGVVVGLSAILFNYRNRTFLLGILSVVFTFASLTVLPVIVKRMLTVTNLGKDYSFLTRRDSFLIGLEMLEKSPIIGMGFGSFSKIWREYLPPEYTTYFAQYHPGSAEKFLDMGVMAILVETGIIGLILYLILTGAILLHAWNYRKQAVAAGDTFVQNLASTVFIGIVFAFLTAFIQDNFLYPRIWLLYALVFLLNPTLLPIQPANEPRPALPPTPSGGTLPAPAEA